MEPMLTGIWQRNLPLILERLASLDEFTDDLRHGDPTRQQFEDALNIAHKLAGSLGIFGFMAGSKLAHALQQLLESTHAPDPATVAELVAAIHRTLSL